MGVGGGRALRQLAPRVPNSQGKGRRPCLSVLLKGAEGAPWPSALRSPPSDGGRQLGTKSLRPRTPTPHLQTTCQSRHLAARINPSVNRIPRGWPGLSPLSCSRDQDLLKVFRKLPGSRIAGAVGGLSRVGGEVRGAGPADRGLLCPPAFLGLALCRGVPCVQTSLRVGAGVPGLAAPRPPPRGLCGSGGRCGSPAISRKRRRRKHYC